MAKQIPILFEDEHLLVVDKPPRLLVVQAPGRTEKTIVDFVGDQLGTRVFPVHRLDEDTTGVLVLARTHQARDALRKMFQKHAAKRIYLALVSRAPTPAAGRIESRLREGKDGMVKSVIDKTVERAVTEYRTLERRGRFTLVECELMTGRRNQIRVHMADIRCPIVNDRKYGFRSKGQATPGKRPLLHAHRVAFRHPITEEPIEVVCDAREPELQP